MSIPLKGSTTLVRGMNLAAVLQRLHRDGSLSRARLAQLIGLNKSTVSSLVEELLNRGLVYEEGLVASKTGRPSTLLRLNPRAGCAIGLELGVGYVTILVSNFVGEILWRKYEALDSITQQDEVLRRAFSLVDEALVVIQDCSMQPLGMGISLPGMVDVEMGSLVFSPNLQWRDVPLRQLFSERVGLTVWIDNDANAAALGEHLFGVARHERHFLFIVAGVGVGGGLFLNGELYRGAHGMAGEIGHTSILFDKSRPCRCGNWGCWENSANQSSLIERVRARLEVGRQSTITSILKQQNLPLNLATIIQAAESGDEEALGALSETGEALGLGVANLINIFNPEMVVIGGALSKAGKFILPSVKKVVEERALDVIRRHTRLALSAFGPDAGAMGATALVIQAILSKPLSLSGVQSIQR